MFVLTFPVQEDAFLDYSTSFPLVASSPPVTEGTEVETGEESGRRPSSDPPLHHQLNILEILVVILIGASAAIGISLCRVRILTTDNPQMELIFFTSYTSYSG